MIKLNSVKNNWREKIPIRLRDVDFNGSFHVALTTFEYVSATETIGNNNLQKMKTERAKIIKNVNYVTGHAFNYFFHSF